MIGMRNKKPMGNFWKAIVSVVVLVLVMSGVSVFANIGTPIKEENPIDWWPMFHHDLRHTGYSTSTASDINNLLWTYRAGAVIDSSPTVYEG